MKPFWTAGRLLHLGEPRPIREPRLPKPNPRPRKLEIRSWRAEDAGSVPVHPRREESK